MKRNTSKKSNKTKDRILIGLFFLMAIFGAAWCDAEQHTLVSNVIFGICVAWMLLFLYANIRKPKNTKRDHK